MIFALVIQNVVANIIVADQDFIDQHSELYNVAISFSDGTPYPTIGELYDSATRTFSILTLDTTQNISFNIISVIDDTNLEVNTTVGMSIGDTILQGFASAIIAAITDSTHIVVDSTAGFQSVIYS
jgi:hypothetical protein